MTICSKTDKKKYDNELEANIALNNIEQTNKHHRRRSYRDEPTRAYRCEFCSFWHLTSQTKGRSEVTI